MTEEAARSLNLKLQILEVLRRDEVGDVIRAARSSQTEALNILSSPFLALARTILLEKGRRPAAFFLCAATKHTRRRPLAVHGSLAGQVPFP